MEDTKYCHSSYHGRAVQTLILSLSSHILLKNAAAFRSWYFLPEQGRHQQPNERDCRRYAHLCNEKRNRSNRCKAAFGYFLVMEFDSIVKRINLMNLILCKLIINCSPYMQWIFIFQFIRQQFIFPILKCDRPCKTFDSICAYRSKP